MAVNKTANSFISWCSKTHSLFRSFILLMRISCYSICRWSPTLYYLERFQINNLIIGSSVSQSLTLQRWLQFTIPPMEVYYKVTFHCSYNWTTIIIIHHFFPDIHDILFLSMKMRFDCIMRWRKIIASKLHSYFKRL